MKRKTSTIKVRKNISNKTYLLGDFDNDGVKNIDDKYPFNRSRSARVNPEVSLASTFIYLDAKRKKAEKVALKLSKMFDMDYRVKDVYSIINKLVRQKLATINDFAGLRKTLAGKRKLSREEWIAFNRKMKTVVKAKENHYKLQAKSKNPYRAYHTDLVVAGVPIEAQFRTAKFGKLNDSMHTAYKAGKNTKPFLKKSRNLVKKGY